MSPGENPKVRTEEEAARAKAKVAPKVVATTADAITLPAIAPNVVRVRHNKCSRFVP